MDSPAPATPVPGRGPGTTWTGLSPSGLGAQDCLLTAEAQGASNCVRDALWWWGWKGCVPCTQFVSRETACRDQGVERCGLAAAWMLAGPCGVDAFPRFLSLGGEHHRRLWARYPAASTTVCVICLVELWAGIGCRSSFT